MGRKYILRNGEKVYIPEYVPDLSEYAKKSELKTINSQSIVGSGNITIQGGSGSSTSNDFTDTYKNRLDTLTDDYIISLIPVYDGSVE